MDDLDDELDLRFHRGRTPEVYYRCPSSESLDGALRNELDKSAQSLIPIDIVTEFVFTAQSTITVPVAWQPHLDDLFQPADYPQSIPVDAALCRGINGKERLKLQRAIARSLVESIEGTDGFRYIERQAWNKDGSDGARFKFLCTASVQNMNRYSTAKKEKDGENANSDGRRKSKPAKSDVAGYDCGGAVHVKFSTKRDAVNIVYKHNPIHRDVDILPTNGDSTLPALASAGPSNALENGTNSPPNGAEQKKPKNKPKEKEKKTAITIDNDFHDPHLDMSTSPEARKATKKKRKKSDYSEVGTSSSKKKAKKTKQTQSPAKARSKPVPREGTPPPVQPVKGKCLRCREKGIKCNEARPTCNQCRRGLWTCQYEQAGLKKRSKNGCLNCRVRKRKCTEEKPSCAYCLKVDDDCEYAE